MRGLSGRNAVVTGGARGIGKCVAGRLSEEGCQVWLLDRDPAGEETARALERRTGNPARFIRTDIAAEDQVRAAFLSVAAEAAEVSVLVNNAAAFVFEGIEATADDWAKTLNVNVIGASLVTRYCVPLMKRRGGAIINVSSISGLIGQPGFATYNASKFAIRGLTKCWAIDLAPNGIRVNAVCPSYTASQAFDDSCRALGLDAAAETERIARLHPLGRMGRETDVAGAVAFLASDDAVFMTGSDLLVDGGFLAQ